MASKKIQFVQEVKAVATRFAAAQAQMKELADTYFDRGYGNVGADPITDEDIASLEVTAVQVAGLITLSEQVEKLLNGTGNTCAASDFDSNINKLRNDF